jgi:hypothetical protein
MSASAFAYLPALRAAAETAVAAETAFRREAAQKIASLESERKTAYRRLNLLADATEIVRAVERDEQVASSVRGWLADRIGWTGETAARAEALDAFAPVALSMRNALAGREPADVAGALEQFERWYLGRFGSRFWDLFENQMPETPLVDF